MARTAHTCRRCRLASVTCFHRENALSSSAKYAWWYARRSCFHRPNPAPSTRDTYSSPSPGESRALARSPMAPRGARRRVVGSILASHSSPRFPPFTNILSRPWIGQNNGPTASPPSTNKTSQSQAFESNFLNWRAGPIAIPTNRNAWFSNCWIARLFVEKRKHLVLVTTRSNEKTCADAAQHERTQERLPAVPNVFQLPPHTHHTPAAAQDSVFVGGVGDPPLPHFLPTNSPLCLPPRQEDKAPNEFQHGHQSDLFAACAPTRRRVL
jgi:hypothetical protein